MTINGQGIAAPDKSFKPTPAVRVGVTQAGYSLWEESPIIMLTFPPPAIVARLISWRFL